MLSITRKQGESVYIGDSVKVKLLSTSRRKNRVSLRIKTGNGTFTASYQQGQDICLDKIRLVVVRFKSSNRIILGIEAPPEITILREELVERKEFI